MVGQIELDVSQLQKILAENEVGVGTEIVFPRDEHAPTFAHGFANLELIDPRRLDACLAADTEHPNPRSAPRETESVCGRAQDQAVARSRIKDDADLLAVDRAVDDEK